MVKKSVQYWLRLVMIVVVAIVVVTVLPVMLPFIISLVFALILLPVVIGMTTASLLWTWLFNDQVGIFSAVLMDLGWVEEPVQWLAETHSALASIVVMVLWKASGFTMVILLVGMQAIPQDLYEAARLDGARWYTQIRHVTIPLMRRTFALALTMSLIGSFLAFEQFFVMTRGGPFNSTISVVHWIYRASFTYFKLGYGAAMSVLLLLILLALSVLQMYLLREDDHA